MKKNKTRFSIIIPAYNVEKYLAECVNSVLRQKYDDFEILLIDDGSNDQTACICDEFKKNTNVHVYHKDNEGVAQTRNYGVNIANGDYVIFLDSDDYWCNDDFLKDLNDIILQNAPELIISDSKKVYETYTKKTKEKIIPLKGNDIRYLIVNNYFRICAWDKVVRRDILINNNICFRKGVLSEEIEWCAILYKYCNNVFYYNKKVYCYRQRLGSITKSVNRKHILNILEGINICESLLKEMAEDKKKYFNYYVARVVSMLIIARSKIVEDLSDIDAEISTKSKYLIYSKRIREPLLWMLLKMFSLKTTLKFLRLVSKCKKL